MSTNRVVAVISLVVAVLFTWAAMHFHQFSIPSVSMHPTLHRGEVILAERIAAGEARRGDVIVVRAKGVDYVKRLVGLPGERVAVRSGNVFINGRAAPQRPMGELQMEQYADAQIDSAQVIEERLPGTALPHRILNLTNDSFGDEFAEQTVPDDHYFLLGDNRDDAADSRFPSAVGGIGFVPIADAHHRMIRVLYGPERDRWGTRVR